MRLGENRGNWKKALGAWLALLCLTAGLAGCLPRQLEENPIPAAVERPVPQEGKQDPSQEDPAPEEGELTLHFLDVGQADAILVESGDETMLVDAGDLGDGEEVVSYLEEQGVDQLDYLVMTHPHADHIGGIPQVLEAYPVSQVLMPQVAASTKLFEEVTTLLEEKELPVEAAYVGMEFSLGEAQCRVLGPVETHEEDLNNSSVVLRVSLGNQAALLMGDTEEPGEEAIMDTGETLEAGLLKIGHHGSDTGTSLPFLQAVAPEAAVISVGEGNSYDMPHDSVLDRLGQMGVALYRTDLQGTIVAQTQGETWEIQGGIPAPVLDSGNPQEASYVGNQNSKVFHRPDCPSVGKMKEENQVGFASRQEALDQGYDPCQNCNP